MGVVVGSGDYGVAGGAGGGRAEALLLAVRCDAMRQRPRSGTAGWVWDDSDGLIRKL